MHFKVQDAPHKDWPWIIERLDLYVTGAFKAVEAVDSSGRIRGMVGYDRWTENAVEMHCAVDHPAAWLALLGPGLRYPFEQAYGRGVGLVYGVVRDDNDKVKKFLCRLGWTMVHRIREGWSPTVDQLVFEMRKRDWYSLRADRIAGQIYHAHDPDERRAA